MKTLVAFPSTAIFGQQTALAFAERDQLAAFLTTFAWRSDSALARLLEGALGTRGAKLLGELARREISILPPEQVETRPLWEVVRTLVGKFGGDRILVDRIWDHLSRAYTRSVGQRLRHGVDALYAYEYTALEAFEAAKRRNIPCILDFPSLDSRQFETLQRAERANWPELRSDYDAYFDGKFEERQARRDAEARLADVVITNSSVARESHIRAGVDPERIIAVNYGAPPPIPSVGAERKLDGPLRVVWAGTFSIRKAAHLFVEAWRSGEFHRDAVADIYGAVMIPDRLYKPAPAGMTFHGSVVRSTLYQAYQDADVLIFPTLSDGFGMVVTEAFSRGLPVITTNQAGAVDLVRDRQNGLVIEAGNPQAIGDALRWCLENRAALADMRQVALDTARNWQWSDFRAGLYDAVTTGLTRAGFETASR